MKKQAALVFLLICIGPGIYAQNRATNAIVTTSYVSPWEDMKAVNDGFEPANSADHSHGAYGNWRGEAFYNTYNWVEYEFPREYALYQSDVYWWNDGAGIGTPTSNYLEYWDRQSATYKPVTNPIGYGNLLNQYNKTKFDTIITDRIRIYSKSDLSTGMLEWKVFGLERGNAKPLISISSPTDQSEFANNQFIDISVDVIDTDGQVVKVEFYANDILIGSATASPFMYHWMPGNNTRYFVKAIAYDNQGGRTVSTSVKIKVGTGKEIYWSPSFNGNSEFSMSRSAQSENFIIFWGNKFPADQMPFNPTEVLSLAEGIYHFYVRDPNGIKFISEVPGTKLGRYKMIIIINETWENESFTGWAYGGGYDNTIGALWIHYGAVKSPGYVIAHELTHSLQAQVYADNPNSVLMGGFIWETHAEFMTVQYFKDAVAVGGSDIARYLRTSSFGWLSDRHHYACWYFLQHIADKYGVEIVNRLWYEKQGEETPVASLARLIGTDQQGINDEFGLRSMKNVTWDYSIGDSIHKAEKELAENSEIFWHDKYTVPDAMDEQKGWYRVPRHKAPQDYGYNIIPLYPNAQNGTIDLGFSGYDNAPAGGAGWRYGFVAVDINGKPRYSPLYKDNNTMVAFDYTSNDKKIYLVVTGTPNTYHPFVQWDQGYQKTYRYPYKIYLGGAKPEGYSPGYNKVIGIAGAPHPNGGGFVASTATVSSTAFVGPNAQVLETAIISGNARIEDHAIIKGNAQVRDNAVVKQWSKVMDGAQVYGDAIVSGTAGIFAQSEVFESAKVTGSAGVYFSKIHGSALIKDISTAWDSNFSGTLILGGDAEPMPEMVCDKGTYLHSMYTNNRNCDGLTVHNLNVDINPDVYADNDIGIKQSITFNSIDSKTVGDPDFKLTATASSKLPVTYSSSDPTVASINGDIVTILKAGVISIMASQEGDNNYLPAPSQGQTLTVNKINQYITFNPIESKTMGDPEFTVTATASSGLAVSFSNITGNVSINGSTIKIIRPGPESLRALQSGNDKYSPAPYVEHSFCVNPAQPVITITNPNTTFATFTSSATSGNQWYLNDVAIAGESGNTLSIKENGVYTVQSTVMGCESKVSEPFNFIITAVEISNLVLSMRLFPSPASQELHILLTGVGEDETSTYTVYDIMGRVLDKQSMIGQESLLSINHYLQGKYILRLTNKKFTRTAQFVK